MYHMWLKKGRDPSPVSRLCSRETLATQEGRDMHAKPAPRLVH